MNTNPYTNAWAPIRFVETGINEDEVHNIVDNAVAKERQYWQNEIQNVKEAFQHNFLDSYALYQTLKKLINENKVKETRHNINVTRSHFYFSRGKKEGLKDPNVLYKKFMGESLYHLNPENQVDNNKKPK